MTDLRAQVEALFGFDITTASGPVPSDNYVSRAAVLALIEARAEPRAEGLDVERLARALYVIWPNDNQWDAQPVWFREKADAIAREYAALEEPTP